MSILKVLGIFVCLLLIVGIKLLVDTRGAIDPKAADYTQLLLQHESALVRGRCSGPENIDRWALQQTWFDTPAFENVAIVFGQSSFTEYDPIEPSMPITKGAFCIEGNTLQVRYFESRFVPIRIGFDKISYGHKIRPLEEDTVTILSIDTQKMEFIRSGKNGTTIFRKN